MNTINENKVTTSEIQTVNNNENVKNEVTNDEIKLRFIDKDFALECMAVPTHSKEEYRLLTFIVLWARRNGIKYEYDSYGNIYLTKGELAEGEFYPCVTSHLDTVQDKQSPYIKASVPLDLKITKTKDDKHKLSVDTHSNVNIGIGADDKSGVCICLSIFNHVDKLKACFFLEEEIGCLGSTNLDKEWFKDVGYVIGFDSPELHRAAWSCSGVKLFSYEFYEKYMKDVCDKWGLTKGHFFSEPWTDVKIIRQETDIMCMNFGNGGYEAHCATEYCILEDMDSACGMGIDLVKFIGNTEHKLKYSSSSLTYGSYIRNAQGVYEEAEKDDTKQLEELGDTSKRYAYGYNYSTNNTAPVEKDIKYAVFKYVVSRYDSYVKDLHADVGEAILKVCKEHDIDPSIFTSEVDKVFNTEIKF